MSKKFDLNKRDLIRGLQYSAIIFIAMFLFEVSTQQAISYQILMGVLSDTFIAWSGIILTKYFTDYAKK